MSELIRPNDEEELAAAVAEANSLRTPPAVMGAGFLLLAVRVRRERSDRAARRMFLFSILYLVVLFAALIIERA